MRYHNGCRRTWLGALTGGLLVLTGCIEYHIDTIVDPDGSGARLERMTVRRADRDDPDTAIRRHFGELLSVTPASRWTHTTTLEDGDTVHTFRRRTGVDGARALERLSNSVHIAGATADDSLIRLGTVRLGDVRFHNTIVVEDSNVAEGRALTYRETFYWDNLAQVLVEYLTAAYVNGVTDEYQGLASEQQRRLSAFVSGSVWFAVGQGLFDASGTEAETVLANLAQRVARQAVEVLRPLHPDVSAPFFAHLFEEIYDDEDTFEERVLARLPGVRLAVNCEIEFRLTMPGTVLTTNAHRRDGDVLVWEFTPGDALTAPLQIMAESLIGH